MTFINAVSSSTFNVGEASSLVIVGAAVAAPTVMSVSPRVAISVVVFELLFGILIGRQMLDIAPMI